MLTTNDWNVFHTTEFDGLGLTPYNFNVHFTLPPPTEHESRDFRIRQYIAVRVLLNWYLPVRSVCFTARRTSTPTARASILACSDS